MKFATNEELEDRLFEELYLPEEKLKETYEDRYNIIIDKSHSKQR